MGLRGNVAPCKNATQIVLALLNRLPYREAMENIKAATTQADIADTHTGPAADRATRSCEKIEKLFKTMPTHGIARDLAEAWLEATGFEVKAR